MAKYMQFDFSDYEEKFYPIIVRIDKDISYDLMKKIDDIVNGKINEYFDKDETWDTDEILIDNILKEISKQFDFTYEIIGIDYTVQCN